MVYVLAALALLGHFALWIGICNRMHGKNLPFLMLKAFNGIWYSLMLCVPLLAAWLLVSSRAWSAGWPPGPRRLPVLAYAAVCWVAAVFAVGRWLWRRGVLEPSHLLTANHTRRIDVTRQVGSPPVGSLLTRVLARVPGNQILQLHVHTKTLRVDRLPPELDGLTITHLSDLHFTGQLTRPFFDEVVRQTNDLDADLVAVTGDIIDKPRCLDWIPETLGRLRSRHGVYFVLGNHDKRWLHPQVVRKALTDVGLIDLGGRWILRQVRGQPVLLAGNELPWLGPAADMSTCPDWHAGRRPLRILLAHTPDQIDWARASDIDLMLVGHTHGGQVRLPVIGPVLSPSRFGVDFCGGTYHRSPTLLHVTRGISGTRQLRINCPPEVAKLELKAPQDGA